MIITFDSEADMVYVYVEHPIAPGGVERTKEVTNSVLADYADDGRLLGIEVFGVDRFQTHEKTRMVLKSLLSEADFEEMVNSVPIPIAELWE